MYPKALVSMLAVCIAATAFAVPTPVSGDFDIIDVPGDITGISFDPLPWSDLTSLWQIEIFPYATSDYTQGYSGNGQGYNLGQAILKYGTYSYIDDVSASGDLAIRFLNWTDQTITTLETIIAINLDGTPIDVYVPEFTFAPLENMHFWVASDGSSYYANTSHAPGGPNQTAAESIANSDIARQAIPEPASITLILAGTLLAIRKRK